MSDSRTPDRKRTLLFVLVGVAVVAIPGRLAWSMRSDTVGETEQVREQTRVVREQVAQARRDEARRADLNDQLQLLAQAMPPDADLPSVVEALASLATESNVVWRASSQSPPAAKTTDTAASAAAAATTVAPNSSAAAVDKVNAAAGTDAATTDPAGSANPTTASYLVEIDVSGTAAALSTYLEKIRSLTRLLTVERVSLTWGDASAGVGGNQAVTAHLTLRAYSWAGAPKQATGAGTTTTTVSSPSSAAP